MDHLFVLYFAIYMYRGKIIGIFSSAREVIANPVESFKNLKSINLPVRKYCLVDVIREKRDR